MKRVGVNVELPKRSVSWRIPEPLIEIAMEEAETLGLRLPALIIHILAERYRDKLTKNLFNLK